MATQDFDSLKEQMRKQLDCSRQNWLLGAGISYLSKIPLMYPLTARVAEIIDSGENQRDKEIYLILKNELDDDAHIEHYLSHIGDLIALSNRSKTKKVTLQKAEFNKDELISLYRAIIKAITDIIRYGYWKDSKGEIIGNPEKPIVEIDHHLEFVRAIYSNLSNFLSRARLTFFTTNYDTLLEDALGLEKFTVVDGFSGGAVGYWNPQLEFQDKERGANKCFLYKLHGSIDWQRDKNNEIIRARYGTNYLADTSDIMIYPQATKYIETQKDPFAHLFQGFKTALNSGEDNILVTCGYCFGDEHINAEISASLSDRRNRTTLVAFSEERPNGPIIINPTIDKWINESAFGNRIYVAGKKGLYYNSTTPLSPPNSKDLDWWTFAGLTKFIITGDYE